MPDKKRLQVFLRDCGLGSRREVEKFIAQGKVMVNGEVAQIGMSVDPDVDSIKYKGRRLAANPKVHFLLHKPLGFVCTTSDPYGRPKAIDLIRPPVKGLFTVGRLDINTSGLVIVTNDGEFSQALIHPSSGHTKEYVVVSKDRLPSNAAKRLARGVKMERGPPAKARVLSTKARGTRYEITLEVDEGRHHLVRDLMTVINVQVEKLRRTRVGPFELGGLGQGQFVRIPRAEVDKIISEYKG